MEIAGLALTSASAAHELFVCGKRIYRRIRKVEKLNAIWREFQMFDLKDNKLQLQFNIALAQRVLKSPAVERKHKRQLEDGWKRITHLLSRVNYLVKKIIRHSSVFATRARHKARDELLDLGGANAVTSAVDKFQLIVMAVRELEKEDSPLRLSHNAFRSLSPQNRVFNSNHDAFFGRGRLTHPFNGISDTRQWFLFENTRYSRQDEEATKQNVGILAKKLQQAQSHAGILRLAGFRDDTQSSSFQLIFACPFRDHPPDSLERYLKSNPTKPPLKFRVSLCSQLATAVLQTMTLGLVHKNIRPENILLLREETTVGAMGGDTPGVFLTGWQYARHVDPTVTSFRGEITLRRKIYQHPERQKVEADKEYCMAHDVYSLGVCMIEILTWESLLLTAEPPTMSKNFIAAFKSLRFRVSTFNEPYTEHAGQIKRTLVAMCNQNITAAAGEKIASLVKEFLTCLNNKRQGHRQSHEYQTPSNASARRDLTLHFVKKTLNTLRVIQSAI